MSKRSTDSVGLNAQAPRTRRRRAAQRARLQVRELDSRCCPSCTVQVVNGDTLQILGDQTANAVEVTEGNSGISVVCDGKPSQTFTGIEQVVIRTFAGSDSVKYICPFESPNLARVHFDLGADEDTFSAIGDGVHVASALNFDGDAGPGADVVTFSGLSAPSGQLQVLLGPGQDRFSVSDTKFTGPVDISIDAAAGSDLVEIINDDFVGLTNQGLTALKLNVQLGQGDDRFSMHDSRLACPADVGIDAGAGEDVVEFPHIGFFGLSNPVNALKLKVQLGAGTDTFSVTEGNFAGPVEIGVDGGAGKDVVELSKNNFADIQNPPNNGVSATVRINLAAGDAAAPTIDDNHFGAGLSLSYAGGNGADNFSFTNDYSAGPTLLSIDLGGGTNVATIHMDTFVAGARLGVRGGAGRTMSASAAA